MKLLLLTLSLVAVCYARTIFDADVQDHGPGTQPRGGCVRDCTGKYDGDYQSCKGCKIYVSCVAGRLIDNRPCAAGTVWHDLAKRCMHHSATCTEPATESDDTTTDVETQVGTGKSCRSNCIGMRDGDYQSCTTCKGYISCVAEEVKYRRDCPSNLVWDDVAKKCLRKSSTCSPVGTTGPSCKPNCIGMRDGDYQSCKTCRGYISCVAQEVRYRRACPANLVWDDIARKCYHTSSTCTEPGKN